MSETMPVNYAFEDALIRVIARDGEPWFVAKDICVANEVQNVSQALESLDDDEKGICSTYTLGGEQEMLVVSESGLYTLILRSRQATTPGTPAHRFRKWVTAELLPQIRKTGRYAAAASDDPYEINTKLRMISMASRLFGREASRHLWQELGLPPVPEMEPRVRQQSGALQGLDFVKQFLAERTAEAPGGRVQARELSVAYSRWAADAKAPVMSERSLAMCLDALGIAKTRGHVVHYLGLRILHLSEFAADLDRQ